jgi:hypothetical protein
MGQEGIETVEKEYALSVTSEKLLKVLQGLTGEGRGRGVME